MPILALSEHNSGLLALKILSTNHQLHEDNTK